MSTADRIVGLCQDVLSAHYNCQSQVLEMKIQELVRVSIPAPENKSAEAFGASVVDSISRLAAENAQLKSKHLDDKIALKKYQAQLKDKKDWITAGLEAPETQCNAGIESAKKTELNKDTPPFCPQSIYPYVSTSDNVKPSQSLLKPLYLHSHIDLVDLERVFLSEREQRLKAVKQVELLFDEKAILERERNSLIGDKLTLERQVSTLESTRNSLTKEITRLERELSISQERTAMLEDEIKMCQKHRLQERESLSNQVTALQATVDVVSRRNLSGEDGSSVHDRWKDNSTIGAQEEPLWYPYERYYEW